MIRLFEHMEEEKQTSDKPAGKSAAGSAKELWQRSVSHVRRYTAEFAGTLLLVLVGCGTIAAAGARVGNVGISFAFGFSFIAAWYAFRPASGCHLNPAVSIGFYTAGKLSAREMAGEIIAQFLGAIAGAALLWLIMRGRQAGYDVMADGLGQTDWSKSPGGYSAVSAFFFEFLGTMILVSVFLAATGRGASVIAAGLAIGLTLTALHLFGLTISGASLNPARSFGPAVFAHGDAWRHIWLYLLAPALGGIGAGLLNAAGVLGLPETVLAPGKAAQQGSDADEEDGKTDGEDDGGSPQAKEVEPSPEALT